MSSYWRMACGLGRLNYNLAIPEKNKTDSVVTIGQYSVSISVGQMILE